MKLQIINGPNLNLLGTRETKVYGNMTFDEYFKILKNKYSNLDLHIFQSNVEGEIINKIHEKIMSKSKTDSMRSLYYKQKIEVKGYKCKQPTRSTYKAA